MSTYAGVLWVVPTPIGNLEDITLRALRVLRETSVIAAEDTRKTGLLLSHFGLLLGKELISYFDGNEAYRTDRLINRLLSGEDVALVSDAGMPLVSDPGGYLIQAAIRKNVKVCVLPGPSAAITALVGAGFPSTEFLFVGFPPSKQEERYRLWNRLQSSIATLILYESPRRLAHTLKELIEVLGADRLACVARELSKLYEEYKRGTLAELYDFYQKGTKGEVCLVISPAKDEYTDKSKISDSLEETIREEIKQRLSLGEPSQSIAALLALRYGKSKRLMYQLALLVSQGR